MEDEEEPGSLGVLWVIAKSRAKEGHNRVSSSGFKAPGLCGL